MLRWKGFNFKEIRTIQFSTRRYIVKSFLSFKQHYDIITSCVNAILWLEVFLRWALWHRAILFLEFHIVFIKTQTLAKEIVCQIVVLFAVFRKHLRIMTEFWFRYEVPTLFKKTDQDRAFLCLKKVPEININVSQHSKENKISPVINGGVSDSVMEFQWAVSLSSLGWESLNHEDCHFFFIHQKNSRT